MRIVPERRVDRFRPANRIIGCWSPEFGGQCLVLNGQGNTASFNWPSASKPIAIPFTISQPMMVDRLAWKNGSSPGSSWDIGVYTTAWVRMVSSGSVGGTGVFQTVDVTDTFLPAGRYYLVICHNSTTASRGAVVAGVSSIPAWTMMGVMDSTTNAFPLPDPLTNMVANTQFNRLPWFAIYGRDPF